MTKKAPTSPDRELEMKIHGFNACMGVFKSRPTALIRLYLTEKRLKTLSPVMKYCAEKKLAYHVVSEEELAKVSESTHHEGLCMVIRRKKRISETEMKELAKDSGQWLALENVENPHNLGAIVRSAAHFGVKGVFLVGKKEQWQNGAFYRTAEGGAEAVAMISLESISELFQLTKKLGLTVLATTGHKGNDLYEAELPAKAVFLMGAEGMGLSSEALKLAPYLIKIPGTGMVESLNVSAATAVILGEWFRQHQG